MGDNMGTEETIITRSFKLLSAYYEGGISRDDVSNLAKNTKIDWMKPQIEDDINAMSDQLLKADFFKYWGSWGKSLRELTQEAIAMNYTILILKDWERKGKPTTPSSTTFKQFIMNAKNLLDKSIYEYMTNQWKGSSDSKIKKNIEAIKKSPDVWTPIESVKWNSLISELIDEGILIGGQYSKSESIDPKIKLLLIYCNVLNSRTGPDKALYKSFDYDHIIPKNDILSSANDFAKNNISNIFNIETLPKSDNIIKGDKPLSVITEEWKIDQIERYSYIPRDKFDDFSKAAQMKDLKEFRGKEIKKILSEKRVLILNN